MKFKHIESLFRIIRAFLNFLFLIFIIYLFIHSFIHSLLFFLPPSNTILSRLRYSITFLHPRVCPSAYCRRCRVPIVSWLELCCLASRSDSRHVITRWLDDRRGVYVEKRRRSAREERVSAGREGGERMIGMACTKFGSFSFSGGNSKNLVYTAIPDQRPGRCARVSIRLLRD